MSGNQFAEVGGRGKNPGNKKQRIVANRAVQRKRLLNLESLPLCWHFVDIDGYDRGSGVGQGGWRGFRGQR